MSLGSEDVIRITKEVTLGIVPDDIDTEEQSKFRLEIAEDVRAIQAAGLIVEIPYEVP